MLWQNHNSIIIGKHQNTIAEINSAFVNANNVSVVRRLSGGGAVYHDMGNLNFTFIMDSDTFNNNKINFIAFTHLVQNALISLGIPAEFSGRNDLVVDGKKISGNAQYIKQGRVMHHGTLLYDSNLDMLSDALNVSNDKIESKGIKSVRSRVTNIRPFMKTDMNINEFWTVLKNCMFKLLDMEEFYLTAAETDDVVKLKKDIYSMWSWNYGSSPPYNIRKVRYIDGCGKLEILLDVKKHGIINNIVFFGDFFGDSDPDELSKILGGSHFEYNELAGLIKGIDITKYFYNLDKDIFLSVLFE